MQSHSEESYCLFLENILKEYFLDISEFDEADEYWKYAAAWGPYAIRGPPRAPRSHDKKIYILKKKKNYFQQKFPV